MDSETLHMSGVKFEGFGAEKNLQKRVDRVECQSSSGCLSENLVPEGMSDGLFYKKIGGVQQKSSRLSKCSTGCLSETIQHDIVAESRSNGCISTLINIVTDSSAVLPVEHQICETGATNPLPHDSFGQQNGMTLHDMYHQQDHDDYNDDDDSDWEPLQKHVVRKKWFCINCTMVNFEDGLHCDVCSLMYAEFLLAEFYAHYVLVCGEHKESEILRLGFFASHLSQGDGHSNVESKVIERSKDSCSGESTRDNCTAVGFDERMLLHSEVQMKSNPHPERPDRLRAIVASLATAGIFPGKCFPIPSREITQEELCMVHSLEHIKTVEFTSSMLSSYFTPDTYANEHSACAARLAAGFCADLAAAIMSGSAKNGFALVRPPGHHAGVKQAMGFCLHNNAAVAAMAARAAGAQKVLILDWDVHHGNGTQEIFEGDSSVLYISLHRYEGGLFYPGTGAAEEVGTMGAEGYCVNIPWKCGGVGDHDYIFAFHHIVLPIGIAFDPDLIIISAGFDAARGDPLGCCDVTPAGFAQMAYMLSRIANGKLLVILEGGYNLRSISSSATAVIKVLLGENPGCEMGGAVPSKACLKTVLEVLKIQLKFWPVLESSYNKLQSQWESFSLQIQKKRAKKRRILLGPIWWKWGRKRFMYSLFYGKHRLKVRRGYARNAH